MRYTIKDCRRLFCVDGSGGGGHRDALFAEPNNVWEQLRRIRGVNWDWRGGKVSLTAHNYIFVSEKNTFYEKFDGIFRLLKNAVIEQVYGVWDCMDNRWFDDAPMLIKTSVGTLSVK